MTTTNASRDPLDPPADLSSVASAVDSACQCIKEAERLAEILWPHEPDGSTATYPGEVYKLREMLWAARNHAKAATTELSYGQ